MRFSGRKISPGKSGQTIITGVLEFDIETDSGHIPVKDKKWDSISALTLFSCKLP